MPTNQDPTRDELIALAEEAKKSWESLATIFRAEGRTEMAELLEGRSRRAQGLLERARKAKLADARKGWKTRG